MSGYDAVRYGGFQTQGVTDDNDTLPYRGGVIIEGKMPVTVRLNVY